MGQTREQLLHFIWQVDLTKTRRYFSGSRPLRGVTQFERVPIGQNEHHVRGAKINESVTPTTVVISIIIQNTRPMATQSPHAKYICTPNMVKINSTMNRRKPNVRTKAGIGL